MHFFPIPYHFCLTASHNPLKWLLYDYMLLPTWSDDLDNLLSYPPPLTYIDTILSAIAYTVLSSGRLHSCYIRLYLRSLISSCPAGCIYFFKTLTLPLGGPFPCSLTQNSKKKLCIICILSASVLWPLITS